MQAQFMEQGKPKGEEISISRSTIKSGKMKGPQKKKEETDLF